MSAVLIYAEDEYTRETIKSTLIDHLPLIVTDDRDQCLEALNQKAGINKAFIGTSSEKSKAALKLFDDISGSRPELSVIAVGDHHTENTAIEAVRHGAAGYILIPAEANAILTLARQQA
jgi:DNA-binding NtrC family response regulator